MKVGDKGSGGCILCLLGVLISISSFVGLVGVTVSIFFIRVTIFLFPQISMETLFLVLLFVQKEK